MQKDKARKETDELLKQTEKRLAKIYAEAQNDIAKKWDAYMKEATEKIKPYEEAYQKAKERGDEQAKRSTGIALSREKNKITIQNQYYKDMLDYTTEQLAHTNEKALDYVNNQMPRVYGINYNGTIDQIKTDAGRIGMGVSFNLLDERTIRNLVQTDKLDLPRKQLEKYKDKAWNAKAINSQLLQGILQGETIPQMAARLQNVINMDEAAANRNARTMTTSAENSGRMDGMKAAEEKGLVYEKQWMSYIDNRTRDSHIELNGESVPLDEKFPNGLQYPGDPEGDPGEVYNCRCTMVRHLIGVRRRDGSIATIDEEEPELIFDLPETRQEREERLAREAEAAKATEPEEPAEERTFTKAEQIELMEHYVSDEGFDMNRVARGEDKMINSQGYTKEEVEKFVEDFTQLLDQQSLDKETLVWRGSTADSIIASTGLTREQILENPEELVGKTITEPGFISTTKDTMAATNYAQEDVLWDIELPEGAKAIHENELLPYLDTDEYTIQRDSSFEVTDVYVRHFDEDGNPYPNGGFIRISAKYVSETDKESAESMVYKWGIHGNGGLEPEKADQKLKLAGIDEMEGKIKADIRASGDDKYRIKLKDEEREVVLMVNDKQKEVYLDFIYVENAGQGEGTRLFTEIKTQAEKQGYEKLTAYAAGDAKGDSGYNGYYSLAKFGFDGKIPDALSAEAKKLFDAETIQDLMKTEKSRKWWRENGTGFEAKLILKKKRK